MEISCPSCNSNKHICIGEIPQMNTFAGNILSAPLTQSNLLRCKGCNLYFKWPRFNKKQLDELYQNGNPDNWQYELKNRKDWQIAINWINNEKIGGSILDVGCFDGKFLWSLEGNWNLYGVEINPVAARIAQERGIKIVTNNFSNLKSLHNKFDLITAFDVIEHTEDPLSFIASISQSIKNNGLIMVSSGDTEALTWKISGSRYLYCAIPEHISFINMKWCHYAADKLNLKIEHIERFSHTGKVSLAKKLIDVPKNLIYLVMPSLFAKYRKIKHQDRKSVV